MRGKGIRGKRRSGGKVEREVDVCERGKGDKGEEEVGGGEGDKGEEEVGGGGRG